MEIEVDKRDVEQDRKKKSYSIGLKLSHTLAVSEP